MTTSLEGIARYSAIRNAVIPITGGMICPPMLEVASTAPAMAPASV